MFLVGILLIVSACLCLLSYLLKIIRQKKLYFLILFLQGIGGILIFLLSAAGLVIINIFYSELVMQKFGLIYFLILIFSYIITLSVGSLLVITDMQKVFAKYYSQRESQMKYKEWYVRLVPVHLPLSSLCLIIGIMDIIYTTSLHSLLSKALQFSP